MNVIVPNKTDVDIEYLATVNFISSGRTNKDINALVSFTHQNENPVPTIIDDYVNYYSGSVSSLAIGDTSVIFTQNISISAAYYVGLQANGNTDAYFTVSINDIEINRFSTNQIIQDVRYTAPGKIRLAINDIIKLSVKNTGIINANYIGTIFGNLG